MGAFITIEGPDGAGKTTLVRLLTPLLKAQLNTDILVTREPGGNKIAENIRHIILSTDAIGMDSKTEALLYAAARRQHLVDNIMPMLNSGGVVLCDRFVDSSIAYQGYARHIGEEGIRAINNFATDFKQPDLTLYLDIDVKEGLNRIYNSRTEAINRLDMESVAFHEDVRKGYLMLVDKEPERIVTLDATQASDVLVAQSLDIIKKRFSSLF